MTRRESVRLGTLFGIALALGKLDTLKADGGLLTVPLDQWESVIFIRHGKKIAVSVDEIFNSLSKLDTGSKGQSQ